MCDTSPFCPNDNLERRHSTCVEHKLNNSFSHTTISVTSTMSTRAQNIMKFITLCYANHMY